MDDYKRGLYLAAQRRLEEKDSRYICPALSAVLSREGLKRDCSLDEQIREFFPEFLALFDGMLYFMERTDEGDPIQQRVMYSHSDMPWWETGDLQPRLRMIHFLLEHR